MTRTLILFAALLGITVLIVWVVSGNTHVAGSSQNQARLIYSSFFCHGDASVIMRGAEV